ncbi:hypothetical protein V8C86DRAFT_1512002 [Haematococcus lacustris]
MEPPDHHRRTQSAPSSSNPSADCSSACYTDNGGPPRGQPIALASFAAANQAPPQWWSCAGKAAATSTCPVWPANDLDTGLPYMCDSSQFFSYNVAGAASLPCVHRPSGSLGSVLAMPLSFAQLPSSEQKHCSRCSAERKKAQDGSGMQLPQPIPTQPVQPLLCGGDMGRAPGQCSTVAAAMTCPTSSLGSKSEARTASPFPSRPSGSSTPCSKSGLLHAALDHQQRQIRSQPSTPGERETASPIATLSKQPSLALALCTQLSFEVERCISPSFSSQTNTTAATDTCGIMWHLSPAPHVPSGEQAKAPIDITMQYLTRCQPLHQVTTRAVGQLPQHWGLQAHVQQACELHCGAAAEQQQQLQCPTMARAVQCAAKSGYIHIADRATLSAWPCRL